MESQMGSGNSSMESENEQEKVVTKIGGKKSVQILGFEMLASANSRKDSENFDIIRILMERFHECKNGVPVSN